MDRPPSLPVAPPEVAPTIQASPPKAKKSGCLKWLGIGALLALAVLVGLTILAMIFGGKDHDKMAAEAKSFLELAQSQGWEAAHGRTTESFRSRVTVDELASLMEGKPPSAYQDCDWKWGREDEAGRSTLVSKFPAETDSPPPLRFSFEKSGGSWQVADVGDPVEPAPDPDPPSASGDGTKTFFSFSTAKLKNLRLSTDSENGTGITTEFPDNVKGIYLVGSLVSAMDGTEVAANWYNLDLSATDPAVSKSLQAGSPKQLTFSLVRSADRLLSGPYRLDLVIAGKVKESLKFQIREATLEELKAGAEAGEASDAFRIFGRHLAKGASVVPAQLAVECLQQAAQSGHPQAQFNLGVLYDQGNFLDEDKTAAHKWYRKAAAQGDSSAQFNLALAYSREGGSEIEIDEALTWTRRSSEDGDPLSRFSYGLYLLFGTGVQQDQNQAVTLLEQSAEQNSMAAFALGTLYEDGRGLPADLSAAKRWYQAAADRGHDGATGQLQRLNAAPGGE